MVQFVHDIISNLDWAVNPGHKQTHLIIMDFAKAFDKVPRRAITQIGLLWDKRVHPQGNQLMALWVHLTSSIR